ncbi:MAG TPA: peptidoglycan-binding domain-containing protein [Candidatus Limnocylindria bacterium]|nr:peptidoglycan-binding domain-containing protein [Candidatus Limnocylindria bacterium]
MRTWTVLTALAVALTLTAAPALAQDRAAIENAQKTLKQQGHDPGTVDGVMGPQTVAALRAYQKAQGLDVTGRLDATTLAKLGDGDKSGDQAARPGGEQAAKPAKDEPSAGPSGSPKTSGDTRPSAVDPAQATRTGANAGDGASYSRSNDKGDSALPRQETDKK